jgi:thiol-disulfide isomerase/thioredoxin
MQAQPINQEFISEGNAPKLLGKINKEGLAANTYGTWFQKNYSEYTPDISVINQFKDELKSYTIELFMGTWCGDSKREVPGFYKLLEAAEFPMERLTATAVDKAHNAYKQSPGGEHEGKNIHRVPTFIFYKNGVEVNRITESPVVTLEEDILKIIKSDYIPNYSGVSIVNNLMENTGPEKFAKRSKKLIPELKPLIKSRYELNTYASVLYYSGMTQEGIEVFKLNTLLFPDEVGTYLSLANILGLSGNTTEAILNYEKALKVEPDNEEAKTGINYLKS